jgi:predicted phage terminase large subunit-like protein
MSDREALLAGALARYVSERGVSKRMPGLLEWMPQVSAQLVSPMHLAPIAAKVERVLVEPVEFCFSVPPRHGKTTLLWHAVAWLLLQRPWMRILFAGSEQRRAEREIARARAAYVKAGGKLGEIARQEQWQTDAGGYVRAVGLNGPIIGDGFHVVFVDDPHRGRLEAESKTIREAVVTRFFDDVYTRQEPPSPPRFAGTSFVLVHTRWHVDDLIGQVTRPAENWRPFSYINLPYEDHEGRVLAPDMWPPDRVANHRRNARNWASVYMGQPTPAGGAVFEGTRLYAPSEMPSGCRYAIGVDLAYTAKASADFSVAVVLARGPDERVYVVDVVRRQCRATDFLGELLDLQHAYPGAPMRWYASGTEAGAADFFRRDGLRIHVMPPRGDKKVRALSVSDAWNQALVCLPRSEAGAKAPSWVADFAEEVLGFTGAGDAHDDQVDALAAAFDALEVSGGVVAMARPQEQQRARPWGERSRPWSSGGGRARPW